MAIKATGSLPPHEHTATDIETSIQQIFAIIPVHDRRQVVSPSQCGSCYNMVDFVQNTYITYNTYNR